jgi:hypothetical protein
MVDEIVFLLPVGGIEEFLIIRFGAENGDPHDLMI